jgi:hypothetical protein
LTSALLTTVLSGQRETMMLPRRAGAVTVTVTERESATVAHETTGAVLVTGVTAVPGEVVMLRVAGMTAGVGTETGIIAGMTAAETEEGAMVQSVPQRT